MKTNAGRAIGAAIVVGSWLVAGGLGSCKDDRVSGPIVSVPSDVTLAVGEHATIAPDRVEVGFRKIDGDSRCPVNVQCIWAGSAGVQLWLLPVGSRDSVFAGIAVEGGTGSVESLGYRITATKLVPYPQNPGPIPQSDYRVTLRIEKRAG